MSAADLDAWVRSLDRLSNGERESQWREVIRPQGPEAFLPAFGRGYPDLRKATSRAFVLFSAARHAATHEEARQLGLRALQDRSGLVRYRACLLLACSLSQAALPELEKLLRHPDPKTQDDARAARAAICAGNRHRFVDRANTGRVFLEFAP